MEQNKVLRRLSFQQEVETKVREAEPDVTLTTESK